MPESDIFSTTAPGSGALTLNSLTARRPGASMTTARLATIWSGLQRRQGRQRLAQAAERGQHTVLGAEPRVLVLDGDGVLMARAVQGLDEGRPVADRMARADGAEVPRHGAGLARPAEVEAPGHRHACLVDERVLAVGPPDAARQLPDDLDRIHALPPEVAGVEVNHHVVPGYLAQEVERFGVVD